MHPGLKLDKNACFNEKYWPHYRTVVKARSHLESMSAVVFSKIIEEMKMQIISFLPFLCINRHHRHNVKI